MGRTDHRTSKARRYLVEIAGVAGAGKSSLAREICRRDDGFQLAEFIHARTPGHLVHAARAIPRTLPILAGSLAPGPRLSWADLKLLVYVSGWHRVLGRKPGYGRGVTLLDQGPIYALVRLKAQAKNVTAGAPFERWWNDMLERWTGELSSIVWLDAPDRVLWERINGRAQPHTTKGGPAGAGQMFISRYRQLFEEILDRIDSTGGPEIHRFDTSAASTGWIAGALGPILTARSVSPARAREGRESAR